MKLILEADDCHIYAVIYDAQLDMKLILEVDGCLVTVILG